jgi:hypothetical protein
MKQRYQIEIGCTISTICFVTRSKVRLRPRPVRPCENVHLVIFFHRSPIGRLAFPPKACRGFAHLEFRHDRSKTNSKQYSGKTNPEFCCRDYTDRPALMPHAPVNEEPGSSRIRASPVRNAFGGHVIGSTARQRRLTSGSGSPVKSIKYG